MAQRFTPRQEVTIKPEITAKENSNIGALKGKILIVDHYGVDKKIGLIVHCWVKKGEKGLFPIPEWQLE